MIKCYHIQGRKIPQQIQMNTFESNKNQFHRFKKISIPFQIYAIYKCNFFPRCRRYVKNLFVWITFDIFFLNWRIDSLLDLEKYRINSCFIYILKITYLWNVRTGYGSCQSIYGTYRIISINSYCFCDARKWAINIFASVFKKASNKWNATRTINYGFAQTWNKWTNDSMLNE